MGRGYTIIENEARYNAAIDRRIKANRAKGGRLRWFAANEDAQLIHDWLFGCGQFQAQWNLDPRCSLDEDGYPDHCFEVGGQDYRCKCSRKPHPMTAYNGGEFLGKMRAAVDEWGGLTAGQHAAVRRCYDRAVEKLATRDQRIAEQKAADATTSHIGKVGDRINLTLTVERVLSFDGQYGTTFFNICRDADNNVVVYKGSNGWSRGDVVICKATIKAHDYRDGTPQTIISRPKVASTQLAA